MGLESYTRKEPADQRQQARVVSRGDLAVDEGRARHLKGEVKLRHATPHDFRDS